MSLLRKASIVTTPTAYENGKILSVKPNTSVGDLDFTRNSSATRVNSQGLIEDMQILSGDLVTNGDFATDSDWTIGSAWNISNAKANYNDTAINSITQSLSLTAEKKYKIVFKISDSTGVGARIKIGNSADSVLFFDYAYYTNGVYSLTYKAVSNSVDLNIKGHTSGSSFKLDYISIIEITDDTNLPRIDYTGGVGHWLFEPQRTNLEDKSNGFITWSSNSNITRTADYITSPDGTQNATRLQFTANGFCSNKTQALASYTMSCYAKRNDSGTQNVGFFTNGSSGVNSAWEITSEWKRFSYTFPALNGGAMGIAGVSGADISVYGFQLEGLASYPTSYIPTSGSAVTRLAEAAFGSGSSDLINSTEGVLYAEIAALAEEVVDKRISLSDKTLNNYVSIGYSRFNGNIVAEIVSGGVLQTLDWGATGVTKTNNNKFALSWGSGTMKFYVNGIQTSTESVTSPTGMNDLRFSEATGALPMFSKTKCVAVFKEALIDSELECLSSWNSFTEMAIALGYTIE